MIVTEKDAGTMWCPFVQVEGLDVDYSKPCQVPRTSTITNRGIKNDGEPQPVCIGSKCMAWRKSTEEDKGYCGLAGKP